MGHTEGCTSARNTYEDAVSLAQEITARTGRTAKPVPDDNPKARDGWVVKVVDSGECVINMNAVGYLSPPSVRRVVGHGQ